MDVKDVKQSWFLAESKRLNSEFSISLTGCYSKVEDFSLPY